MISGESKKSSISLELLMGIYEQQYFYSRLHIYYQEPMGEILQSCQQHCYEGNRVSDF